MLYLLAILLPPVAVSLTGRWGAAVLNLLLTLFFVVPGVIHALFVVSRHYADERTNRMIDAQARQNGKLIDAMRQMKRP